MLFAVSMRMIKFPTLLVHRCTSTFCSLMDMGVGAFVFSAAIVSRQTRRLQCTNSNRTTGGGDLISMENGRRRTRIRTDGSCATLLNSAASAALETVRAVSPLLFLGFIRLIGHTAVNYQVHVSEYGVHWNFFFTMASVALLATVLEVSWTCGCRIVGSSGDSSSAADGKDASSGDSSSSSKLKKRGMALSRTTTAALYLVAGIAIATIYQLAIMQRLPAWIINSSRNAEGKMIDVNAPVVHGGLGPDTYCASMKRIGTVQDFVLCAPRYIEAPDSLGYAFLMQNREGIGGILGFFAIYLCGVGLGVLLLAPRRTAGEWRSFFLRSSAGAAALWMALWWAVQPENAGPVSRRLVNAPYVLWVLAFNWTMLLSLLFVDMVSVIYCDKDTPLLKTRQEVLIVNHELEVMGGVAETTGMINDGASVAASELDTPTAQAAGANPAAALLVAPRAAAAPLNFVSGGSVSTSGLRKRRGSVTASAAPSASGAAPQLQSSPGASTTDRSRRSTGRTTVSRSVAAAAVASSASTESDDAAQSSGVSSTSTTAAGGRKRGSSKGRKAAVVGAGGSASVVESPISSVDGDGGCGSGAAALPASRAASVGSGQSQQSSKAAAPQLDQSSCSVGGSNRTLDSAGSGGGGSKRQQRSGFLWSLLSIASSIMLQKPRPFPEHVTSGGSVILDSFNVNFLAIFMVANLLVGVVNLTVYTVHAPVSTAMVLLTLYMAAVCGTATAWRTMGVTLKFW